MASIANATHHAAPPSPQEPALCALQETRERTLALVEHLSEGDLARVHSPLMSPICWDLAHIAAYEDLWLAHRHAGLALLRPDLTGVYDALRTPRAVRGDIEALGPAAARAYMAAVRERAIDALARQGIGDGELCELVTRHELQHNETIRQTLEIAGLLPPGEPSLKPMPDGEGDMEWIEPSAGAFEMGAPADGFAYDNERPRHSVDLPAFQIARHPVSNGGWMRFAEDGGYDRREWWSEAGWAWKRDHAIGPDPAVAGGDPCAAACHVSWHEAEAFARASGARLPTEAEWEKAAGLGALAAVGEVWEWTASAFTGYPGFVAHPYREYSEVFFGDGYRVLRGGSWATSPRVKTLTFRNWDLPERRQIFAGLRLARDVSS
jgi:gamma-glutamyl hercynylcysteine S-oxide synthase